MLNMFLDSVFIGLLVVNIVAFFRTKSLSQGARAIAIILVLVAVGLFLKTVLG